VVFKQLSSSLSFYSIVYSRVSYSIQCVYAIKSIYASGLFFNKYEVHELLLPEPCSCQFRVGKLLSLGKLLVC